MKSTLETAGLAAGTGLSATDFWIRCDSVGDLKTRLHKPGHKARNDSGLLLLHLSSGTCIADHGQTPKELDAGSLLVLPRGTTFALTPSPGATGEILHIAADRLPELIPDQPDFHRFYAEPRLRRLAGDTFEGRLIADSFGLVAHELGLGFGTRHELVETAVCLILQLATALRDDREETAGGRDAARLEKLSRLVARHFREHLPVEFYARELGVSVTHLNRVTRAQTGRTMSELLNDRIVLQARRDLAFTRMTAQEIAYGLGFADPAYFTRFFSRETGETPRRFRERMKEHGLQHKAAAE